MKNKKNSLTKKLDDLASKVVRLRDKGICTLCLKKFDLNKLNAHHWIVTKAHSKKHRWNIKNLLSLCFACHLYKIHSTASLKYIDQLKKNAISLGIVTEKDIEEIERDNEIADFSTGELEELVKSFQKTLKKLEEQC